MPIKFHWQLRLSARAFTLTILTHTPTILTPCLVQPKLNRTLLLQIMYSTDPQVVNRLTSPSNNAGVFATSRSGTGLGSNHFSSGASTGRTVMSSASSHTSAAADRTVSVSLITYNLKHGYEAGRCWF